MKTVTSVKKKVGSMAVAHRLSQHEGQCARMHGHNFDVFLSIESETLNTSGMVLDFAKIKELCVPVMDRIDHGILLNEEDTIAHKLCELFGAHKVQSRVVLIKGDPTAENIAGLLLSNFRDVLETEMFPPFKLSVTVFETENNSATVSET